MKRADQQHIAALKNAIVQSYKRGPEEQDVHSRKILRDDKKELLEVWGVVTTIKADKHNNNQRPHFSKLQKGEGA